MYKLFIDKLVRICQEKSSQKILYDINNLYKMFSPFELGKAINNEILRNFDISKLNIIKNGDNSYYKYNLFNSETFDVFDIKWEKNSFSKIHDHPEKGCIVYMYNDGLLNESNFINRNNKLKFISHKNITNDNISYKISDKFLHKIHANIYSETINIYIPGNFTPLTYKMPKKTI